MILLEIIRSQIKLLFRNKVVFIATIALPIIITALFNMGINNVKGSELYIADLDNSVYSKQFIYMLQHEENIKAVSSSEADIRKRLDDQKISLACIIKKGFNSLILDNKNSLEVLENYENVNNIMLKFKLSEKLSMYQKILKDTNHVAEEVSLQNPEINREDFFMNSLLRIMKERKSASPGIINYSSAGNSGGGKKLDITSQSLLGYIVMFLCFSVIQGARTLIEEKENRTINRLLCTPVNINKYVLGKVISIYVYGVIQIIAILFVSKFLFHISWIQDSILSIGVFLALYLFSVIGIVMIFIPFVKNQQQLSAVSYLVIIVTSMLGGTFFQIEAASKMIQTISRLTIQGWAMKGLTDIILYNRAFTSVKEILTFFVCIGIGGILLSSLLIRGQLTYKKD